MPGRTFVHVGGNAISRGPVSKGELDALTAPEIEDLRRRLSGAVRRTCPHWLLEQTEDMVQDALMRLLSSGPAKSGGIRSISSSYLSRAAYSAVVDEIRRRFRRAEVPTRDGDPPDGNPVGTPGPEGRLRAGEIHEALRACLGAMSRSRRIVVACHLQGYSVPEAAKFTGWTKKKTEHLVRRGMDDLRRCLAEKGMEP